MDSESRFTEAIERIDAANSEDPRVELVAGEPRPKELLFAERVYHLVGELVDDPSEELLLAARAHTIRRWAIPRDRYPMTTVGYHEWRRALADYHAEQAAQILSEVGYASEAVGRVKAFITKDNWPADREARALEDADCLVFLETKLRDYVDDWDEKKMNRVLQRTFAKMTPDAQKRVLTLDLSDRERELLRKAVS